MSGDPPGRPRSTKGAVNILRDPLVGPIVGIVFILLAGFGFVLPVMPLFAKSFGVGNDGAGLFIASFGFARLFGDLIGGSIVDRKGERFTALIGMAWLAVCAAATGAAPNFALAVAGWALAGVGSAIVFASLFSYVLKAAPEASKGRTLSYFYGAFNIGIIAGGAAGGFLAGAFGLEAPLFAYAAVLALGMVAYVRFVPRLPSTSGVANGDNDTADSKEPPKAVIRSLLRVPGFATTLLLSATYLWIVGAIFNTLLPLFAADELGMSVAALGATFAVGVAAEFVVLFPAGSIADRLGRKIVMVPALAGLAVTSLLMGLAPTPLVLTIILAALAVCSGFAGVPPAAMLSDVVPAEHSGRGVGAFRFVGDVGFFLGPLVAGAASKSLGFVPAFAITALVPMAALIVTYKTPETLKLAGAAETSTE